VTSKDPYGRIAGFYDRLVEPLQAGVRSVAIGVASPRPGWRVLDVGCGTGTGLVDYVAGGCEITGVDVSPAMLAKARDRLGDRADLRLTDGGPLPFEAGGFDLVTTSMVLHEVPREARVAFVREMARVAKPEGRLLIVDFHSGPLRWWKGPVLRTVSSVIERFSGHYSGYRSFLAGGGVPGVARDAGLPIASEKLISGGNVTISVVRPGR